MPAAPLSAILTYHSLDASGSVLSTPPALFAEQMRILAASGVRVMSLGELLTDTRLPTPAVAITFDDGFQNVYEHGLSVLVRHGFPATVFLVTGHCGMRHAWAGRTSGIEGSPLLEWREIRVMAQAGIAFGSHSRSHRDLTRIDAQEAEREMVVSKSAIEDALGRPVEAFAYPYGAYNARVKGLVRAHFALACTTTLDFVRPRSDPWALERLDMYYLRRADAVRLLFSVPMRAYIRFRRGLRACRRGIQGSGR